MYHEGNYRLAMDRIAMLQAEAAAERLGNPKRSPQGSIGGWEGRPAHRGPSERILALVSHRPAWSAAVASGERPRRGDPQVDM
jgi:hypothetical protein